MWIDRSGASKGVPGDSQFFLFGGVRRVNPPSCSPFVIEFVQRGGVRIDQAGSLGTAIEPSFDAIPQSRLAVGADAVDKDCIVGVGRRIGWMRACREPGRRDSGITGALGVLGKVCGDVLGFHLNGLVGIRSEAIEKQPSEFGVFGRWLGPKVGQEEGDGPFEIPAIEEQGPAMVACWNLFALGGFLRVGQWQGEIAISEEFPTGALL